MDPWFQDSDDDEVLTPEERRQSCLRRELEESLEEEADIIIENSRLRRVYQPLPPVTLRGYFPDSDEERYNPDEDLDIPLKPKFGPYRQLDYDKDDDNEVSIAIQRKLDEMAGKHELEDDGDEDLGVDVSDTEEIPFQFCFTWWQRILIRFRMPNPIALILPLGMVIVAISRLLCPLVAQLGDPILYILSFLLSTLILGYAKFLYGELLWVLWMMDLVELEDWMMDMLIEFHIIRNY